MTTKYTLSNALAFIAITDSKRGLHIKTLVNIPMDMVGFQVDDLSAARWPVSEAGMELARTSRLWKAHQHLRSLGFRLDRTRRYTPRYIAYVHEDDMDRTAFTGSHGRAYAHPPRAEGERWSPAELVATFKNGKD